MYAHPARFVSGSLSAIAMPAEERRERLEPLQPLAADDQHADHDEDVGGGLAPTIAGVRVGDAAVDDGEDDLLKEPQPDDRKHRDEQVHLHRGAQAEPLL